MRGIVLIIAMSMLVACAAAQSVWAESAEVWMCHRTPDVLFEEGAEWDLVKGNLDVLQVYIGWVEKCSPDRLKKLATVLNENDIKLAMECGGTLEFAPLDDTNGERSAEMELPKIRELADAGITLSYLCIDGPVSRIFHTGRAGTGFDSVDRCVDELVDYLRAVRAVFPHIQFYVITNFPNWGWKGGVWYHAHGPNRNSWGDYYDVIRTIIKKTREADVEIRGVQCDNPYDYAIGEVRSAKLADPTEVDWLGRVRELEEYVESERLEFNLIINSERAGNESDRAFYEETLKLLNTYRASGGTPKRYVVQSWYPYPKKVAPEAEPFTMTALVKEVIKRVKGVDEK